ncbi:hypothetical protein POM88_007113 [Heracleum sosnowskyi]|uniref:Alpha-ketoglutarate-dependent dioxygenase AlkB-like domain-containing protein n=1 Tax=Heracleum sosnowskyi TaxID=360622 RepID=A0AAD8J3T4_9APIA|nr:hypothetical protein POM88_007113 [Heracleum sosnowskyi]
MRIDTHSAFEGSIFSLSLAGPCIMEFRKYTDIDWISKSTSLDKEVENSDSSSSFLRRAIYLPPRSILLLSGEARYAWHHYIPHHKEQSRRKLVTRIEYEKFLQITSRVMVKEPQNMHSGDIQPTGNISKFPRSNVWDPYKRLEITTDASEEEVWSSQNFLLDQYAGHERSVESIEAAFEKILMTSFLNRKKNENQLKKQAEKASRRVSSLG